MEQINQENREFDILYDVKNNIRHLNEGIQTRIIAEVKSAIKEDLDISGVTDIQVSNDEQHYSIYYDVYAWSL